MRQDVAYEVSYKNRNLHHYKIEILQKAGYENKKLEMDDGDNCMTLQLNRLKYVGAEKLLCPLPR